MKNACSPRGWRFVPTSCALFLSSLVPLSAATPQSGTELPEPLFEEVHGDLLDPATYGPGFIETMEQALTRDRLLAPGLQSNPKDRNGRNGSWVTPSRRSVGLAGSGEMYVFNKYGDLRMGISFPMPVDVAGAFFGGQSDAAVWPPALRVLGYRDHEQVATSAWMTNLEESPKWLAMDFEKVDRIVVQAEAALQNAAWYSMDDLVYSPVGAADRVVVLDFEDVGYHKTLTGSGYAGLVWENGSGFTAEEGVPAPRIPAGFPSDSDVADANGGSGGFLGGNATSPMLISDFETIKKGDNGSSSYPPDTCGFAGPDHFVEVVNRVFAVYNKDTGAKLLGMNLGSFLPGSNGDPRVLFDSHSQRWFVMATDFSSTERIFLAISLTSSATGGWFKTSFTTDQGSDAGCWPDYPTLGIDANGLYLSSFMVGCGMSLWAIDKAPLVAGSPSLGAVTAFRNLPYEKAIQPCMTYGTPQGEYFVSVSGSSSIRVRRVNPPLTNPTLSTIATVNVGSHPDPPLAPALGSSPSLNTVDDRIMNAVYRNGSIWCAHNVNQSGRSACRWYEIGTSPFSLIQSGTISDPSLSYYFPGIAVNANDDVVVAFSGSNSSQFAGAYYSGRLSSDQMGQMSNPVQYRAGQAPQNNIDGAGRNRWGDYSLSSVDPEDDLSFWTIQEYGHTTNNWGTHVAELAFDGPMACPDPSTYCVAGTNSTGVGMEIGFAGSTSVVAEDFVLTSSLGPSNQLGIFFYGESQTQVPFGGGFRCVNAGLTGTFRLPVVQLDLFGDIVYPVDWSSLPVNGGPGELSVGSIWNFQFWYRDPAAGGAGFNLSDALNATFCD